MKVTLIQQTEKPIETIAQIASICYDSDPVDPMKLVKHLYRNGHHSVFEHIYFTFKVEGISRACSHQLVRHRMCAFTQRSQRRCPENDSEYVTPPGIREGTAAENYYKTAMYYNQKDYYTLTHSYDQPLEDARYLLPNACETSLYMSFNLREFIHICNERLCKRAQWEIRQLVNEMRKLVDDDLKWMLVPKCETGLIICNDPCYKEVGK